MILKKRETADNPSRRIYVNEIENRIIFKTETEYYFEFLILETIKLLRSTKHKITNDENGIISALQCCQ